MRWEKHAACIGRRDVRTGFWWGESEGKRAERAVSGPGKKKRMLGLHSEGELER
jgi:hypothetical protein